MEKETYCYRPDGTTETNVTQNLDTRNTEFHAVKNLVMRSGHWSPLPAAHEKRTKTAVPSCHGYDEPG